MLVDDREVVDQPFRGRRDRAFVLDRPGQETIRLDEHPAVLGDSRLHGLSTMPRRIDRLRHGQGMCMLLEPFDAEELLDDGSPRRCRGA